MIAHPTLDATTKLAAILTEENAALERMDIRAANTFVAAKQAATEALVIARQRDKSPLPHEARADILRLMELAAVNKSLLERAMVAQNRIMGCIARAMPKAASRDARYGASGMTTTLRSVAPVALFSRA